MAVEVGQEAPDFTLKKQLGDEISLSSFRGDKNVVLMFSPLAFSGTCTTQMTGLAHREKEYSEQQAQVLGVSVDSHHAQAAFAASLGLTDTMLLADFEPKGSVARAYGVYLDERGHSERATFVIDKAGIVRRAELARPPAVPDEDAALAALNASNT